MAINKVLVVDDSATELCNIAEIVAGTGCTVLRAANGKEAVELATREKPDIIFMDIIMPEMDGVEVLQALHSQWEHIPVVVLTADIQENTRQQCLKLGAVVFINKPLQQAEMIQAIKHLTLNLGKIFAPIIAAIATLIK